MDINLLTFYLFGFVSLTSLFSLWTVRRSRRKTQRAFHRAKKAFAESKIQLREIDDELRYLRNKQHSQATLEQLEAKLAEVIANILSEKKSLRQVLKS
ncbi:MAG: hypothetical protein V1811_00515 [Candidatus Micrarchaeota archaeon]